MLDIQDVIGSVPDIKCPQLERIELKSQMFGIPLPILNGQPCRDVHLSICSDDDWAKLLRVIHEDSTCLPQCRRLFLDVQLVDNRGDPVDLDGYSDIRAIAKARDITLSVSLDAGEGPYPDLNEMLDAVRLTKDELVEVHCHLSDMDFQPFEAYEDSELMVLSKCTKIDWAIDEDMGDDQEEMQGHAFEAVMRQIEAPMLETLILNMTTPYSDYIPALLWPIRWGKFPQLRSIEGCLSTGPYEEGWTDQVRRHRKNMLELECAHLHICLDDLEWE